jgi:hypothetical protein
VLDRGWADFRECLSVLKNSFALSCAPGPGAENAVLWCFGLVSGLFWTADGADYDFFNSLTPSRHSGE